MSNPDRPVVSDHAVLRYLERAHGLDVEAIRTAIADATVAGRQASLDGHKGVASLMGGCRFLIKNGVVTTSLRRDQRVRWRRG